MTEKSYEAGSAFPEYKNDTMRLYNMRFCPYTERTRLVLAHKHIPYETINVHLRKKPDWFLERSPFGKVPVLEYNNELVFESDVCDDYLDDKYPEHRLTPHDPYVKAQHRLLRDNMAKWISLYFKTRSVEAEEVEQLVSDMHTEMGHIEKALAQAKTTFFGGSSPGMLDYHIWPWYERLGTTQFELTNNIDLLPSNRFPNLTRWVADMWKTDAVKAVGFDKETHIIFHKSYIEDKPKYDLGL